MAASRTTRDLLMLPDFRFERLHLLTSLINYDKYISARGSALQQNCYEMAAIRNCDSGQLYSDLMAILLRAKTGRDYFVILILNIKPKEHNRRSFYKCILYVD